MSKVTRTVPRGCALALVLLAAAARAEAEIPGRALSTEGRPVALATVNAYAPESAEARARRLAAGQERRVLAATKTTADGSFRLPTEEAVVDVGVRAEGFAPAFATGVQRDLLTLTLAPSALRRGTVTAGGKPVADATIVSGEEGGGEVLAHTAKDGSFEFSARPEQWLALYVLHRDFAPLSARVPPGKTPLRHELLAGVRLSGAVKDEATGRGVPGATVWVDGWPQAESAADGSFTVAHAPSAWTSVSASTSALVGSSPPVPGPLTIKMKAARRLSGMVRDAKTKRAIAGARVTVMGQGGAVPAAVTDARGQYELFPLLPGRYWTAASRPGYATAYLGGEEVDALDVRKAAAARHDFDLEALRQVTGRVQDEKARPMEGALVMLGMGGMGTFYGNTDVFSRGEHEALSPDPVRTNADGSFVLLLPQGFEVRSGGLQAQVVALTPGHAAGTAALPEAATPVVITLRKGVTLAGQVRTEDGAPVADVGISLGETGPLMTFASRLESTSEEVPAWSRSDAQGRFSIQVHPVLHQLWFRKEGYAPQRVDGFDPRRGEELIVVLHRGAEIRGRVLRHDGRGVEMANVSLQDGLEADLASTLSEADGSFRLADLVAGPYTLTVRTESGLFSQRPVEAPSADLRIELEPTTVVRGRVVEANTRNPVTRFNVRVAPADTEIEMERGRGGRQQEFATTDGQFVLEDVPLGASTLSVQAQGYRTETIDDLVLSDEAPPPEIEVALDSGLAVRGRVTSSEGGPLADVAVSAPAAKESVGAATDENGEYELLALAPGEVVLAFQKSGFRSAKRTVPLQQATRVDVTLSRGLSLRGTVVAGEMGVAKAQVHARSSAADAEGQSAVTDASGRFTMPGLAPGRYEVTASATDHGSATLHDVDVEAAGSVRLVLEKSPTAILTGTVVGLGDVDAARPPVVMVQVQSEEEAGGQYGLVDMTGAFRIEDAPAGRVTVTGQAMSPDGSSRSSLTRELTLAPGSEAATVVEFRDELVISGTVIRSGLGLPAATVGFRGSGSASAAGRTDQEGRYQVSLAPGPYTVDVSANGGVSYQTQYQAVESATFDIDVTGGALRGRVVQSGSEVPVASADVTLWPAGESETSPASTLQSNAQGTFEASSLREGRYRVLASKKGFGQQVREVELARGSTADVFFELEPADGVTVTVVDARDNRTLEAIVVVRDLSRRIVANGHAGADKEGAVTIPLSDGPYLLSVSANNYGTVTTPITAPARGLRVGLTPGGTLVIESPRNLRGRARLLQPGGEEYVRCWCNGIADITLEGRRTAIEHITPGPYTLELLDAGNGAEPRPVTLTEGTVTTVTIE